MRHDRGLEEPPEHPEDCGCYECVEVFGEVAGREPRPVNEITDEEWNSMQAERHAEAGAMPDPDENSYYEVPLRARKHWE